MTCMDCQFKGGKFPKTQPSFGWGNYMAAHSHVDPGGRVNKHPKAPKGTRDDAPITEHTSVDGDLHQRCEEYAEMRGPFIASRVLYLSIRILGYLYPCSSFTQHHWQLSAAVRLTVQCRVYQPVRSFQPAAIIPPVGASAVRSFVALGVPSDEPILTVHMVATNDGT